MFCLLGRIQWRHIRLIQEFGERGRQCVAAGDQNPADGGVRERLEERQEHGGSVRSELEIAFLRAGLVLLEVIQHEERRGASCLIKDLQRCLDAVAQLCPWIAEGLAVGIVG